MSTTTMPEGRGSVSGAPNVEGTVVRSGHWVGEQAREELRATLTEFLTPYRAACDPAAHAAAVR